MSGVLCPVLGMPVQKRYGRTEENPAKTTSHMRKGWESCSSLHQRESLGRSCQCTWEPEGRVQREQSQTLFLAAHLQDQRQWAQTKKARGSSEHQETLLSCGGDSTGTGCPDGCGVSILEHIKKLSRHGPGQPDLDCLLWEGLGWTRELPEVS